jgi:hypothetical protein
LFIPKFRDKKPSRPKPKCKREDTKFHELLLALDPSLKDQGFVWATHCINSWDYLGIHTIIVNQVKDLRMD